MSIPGCRYAILRFYIFFHPLIQFMEHVKNGFAGEKAVTFVMPHHQTRSAAWAFDGLK